MLHPTQPSRAATFRVRPVAGLLLQTTATVAFGALVAAAGPGAAPVRATEPLLAPSEAGVSNSVAVICAADISYRVAEDRAVPVRAELVAVQPVVIAPSDLPAGKASWDAESWNDRSTSAADLQSPGKESLDLSLLLDPNSIQVQLAQLELAQGIAPVPPPDLEDAPPATAPAPPPGSAPNPNDIRDLQERLERQTEPLPPPPAAITGSRSAPAISVAIPTGFGTESGTFFIGGSFQEDVRFANDEDGILVFGGGVGDPRQFVGLDLYYVLASFGGSRDFGSGAIGFKVHRLVSNSASVAVGVDGLITVGSDTDFDDSLYFAASKIFRTRSNVNSAFSRVALTAGIGNGRFRTEDNFIDDVNQYSPFGNIAIRVWRPVSIITEWTGQDLALGVSVAPFRNFPLVITPAVRDIAGAGDQARFVIGGTLSFDL